MRNTPESCDVAIIGAGPVGLFAVFECGMLEIGCQVFDALPAPGGQCAALYPEKPIYDIPGYSANRRGRTGRAADRAGRAVRPGVSSRPGRLRARGDGARFCRREAAGLRVAARAVVIAAGAGAFGPNRPPLTGIEEFEEKSVFYLVRRREDFRGRRVVIAGGGDSAVDWALSLAEVAERVIVVHRRAKFRAAPQSAAQLQALADEGRIELVIPYQLHALEGAEGQLSGGRSSPISTAELAGSRPIASCRFSASRPISARWRHGGSQLDHNRISVDPATCATSRPGIFAIGDIAALSRQAQADPLGLRRGGAGGARDPSARPSGRGAAFRIFDNEGGAGKLIPAGSPLSLTPPGARWRALPRAGGAWRGRRQRMVVPEPGSEFDRDRAAMQSQ